jgi:fumarate reductase flavoprotein subunit
LEKLFAEKERLVSSDGKRFTNELDTRDNVTAVINKLPEKSAYLVFDSAIKSRAKATL